MPTNALRRKKISELLPEGVLVNRDWLMENNLSRHAIDNLVKSQQLHSVSKGIYVRGTTRITWQSAVYALQTILKTDFVIGGITALELQGLGHYLSLSGNQIIHLFGNDRLPGWVNELIPEVTFLRHTNNNLFGFDPESAPQLFTVTREWKEGLGKLILSSPERAFLELLSDVPRRISPEHASQLMQGLTTLSPRNLQKLLEKCGNVKVKRLFFWLAEKYNYTWLNKLDITKIDLGSGNRMLVKGGKLDKKYKITVPSSL
ncbi:MAG: type IV toxin-antitoxin system AbiEi family antitoxin domain-containing protein [Daejeonella sp.]